MKIIINGLKTEISDENEELLNELVNRIVNEDIGGVTGNMDFDVASSTNDISTDGELRITYGIFREVPDEVHPDIDGTVEMMDL